MSARIVALVTGGASGLGLATVKQILKAGGSAIIADLPSSNGQEVAAQLNSTKCRLVKSLCMMSHEVMFV